MTMPVDPKQRSRVEGGRSGDPSQGEPPRHRREEWSGLLDIINMIAVDAVGATVILALYTLADWAAANIDSIRHLEWNSGTNFAFTAHDVFKACTFVIIFAFGARSVLKLIRRIWKWRAQRRPASPSVSPMGPHRYRDAWLKLPKVMAIYIGLTIIGLGGYVGCQYGMGALFPRRPSEAKRLFDNFDICVWV